MILIIFLFGLIVGSFLNCVIYRLEKKESFLKGRSYCPNCKHQLQWLDLIPVASFLILKRKCHYCRKKISWHYPLVELATGLLFAFCYLSHLPWIIFALIPFLIIIFVYDLKYCLIPDKVIYPAIVIAAVFNFTNWPSALIAAGFFLALVLVSRGKWMGIGDIKLAFLMGLVLGFPEILLALFSAFMTGAIMGVVLVFLGRKTLKSEVPFGPFLVGGIFIALFWGEKLINWYLNFL